MLFRSCRWIRRQAQDQLAFRNPHALYAGIDLELQQVAHLCHSFSPKIDWFPRPDGTKEFHAPDRGQEKERPRVFRVTGRRRDAGRLRERLGQNHAGNEWIAREMSGENRIIRGKGCRRFRGCAGAARDQFTNKDERWSMWKAEKVTSAV